MTSDIKNIKESLKDNDIIGLVIPDIEYDENLIRVARILSKDYDEILYISINKPYESLVSKFKQNKINTDKFYFIDCITRTSKDVSQTENCYFVSSPKALDEIQTTILDVLKKYNFEGALIDSPSLLLTYYEHRDVLKFMHLLMAKIIIADCKGIFPFPKESSGLLRRSIEMFIDDVVYLSGESNSSNANCSMNLSANFDEMILLLRKFLWNIQFRMTDIKNECKN